MTSTQVRDADRTRAGLINAARKLFSTHGFTQTGVREVAALAGVNSSLVRRYFGSKHGLFRAVLEQVLDLNPILERPRDVFGVDMVAAILDESHDAPGPLMMMLLSAGDPEAHALSVEMLRAKVLEPLAKWLGNPDGDARAAQINILCTGFLTTWKLLPTPALANAHISASTRRWLETEIQRIVDGR